MKDDVLTSDGIYPMRVVARLTGLSPDAIRVWERRYQAVVPHRTSGGSRRFSADDVRRLQLLRQATENGHSICAIANLSESELESLPELEAAPVKIQVQSESAIIDSSFEQICTNYVDAIRKFDIQKSYDILSRAAAVLKPIDFVLQIVVPVLRTIGNEWMRGDLELAHEHLASSQIKSLMCAMVKSATAQPGAARIVVATPSGHWHEFGAMIAAFMAISRGFQVLYLGSNLRNSDLIFACEKFQAKILMLSVLFHEDEETNKRLNTNLQELSKKLDVWVGLPETHPLTSTDTGAQYFSRYEDYNYALSTL
ncbi:MAG: MerR family transcriptional regulator [Myxococcota bacterium]|jgi:methanogenic corrinoid protein MtbC1|nr:MerR family transcriptional regulator [Myxococcota bacterium]